MGNSKLPDFDALDAQFEALPDFDALDRQYEYESLTESIRQQQAKEPSLPYRVGKGLATGAAATGGALAGAFGGAALGPVGAAGGAMLGGGAAAGATEAGFQHAFEEGDIDWGKVGTEAAFGAAAIPLAAGATRVGAAAIRGTMPAVVKGATAGINTFGPTAMRIAQALDKPLLEKGLKGLGASLGFAAGGIKGAGAAYFGGMFSKSALKGLQAAANNPATREGLKRSLNLAHQRLIAASDNSAVLAAQMLLYNDLAQFAKVSQETLFKTPSEIEQERSSMLPSKSGGRMFP